MIFESIPTFPFLQQLAKTFLLVNIFWQKPNDFRSDVQMKKRGKLKNQIALQNSAIYYCHIFS